MAAAAAAKAATDVAKTASQGVSMLSSAFMSAAKFAMKPSTLLTFAAVTALGASYATSPLAAADILAYTGKGIAVIGSWFPALS